MGLIGPKGLSEEALDLLDLGIAVFAIERSLPGAPSVNRTVAFDVEMSVRRPERFTAKPVNALTSLLNFQGDADWTWTFTKRRGRPESPSLRELTQDARKIDQIVLFSGGLDSTCGLAAVHPRAKRTQLVSHYTRQKTKQRDIARELGFDEPTQATFSLTGSGFRGRTFFHRSLYFVCLAASVAASYGIRKILQFENGVLAVAAPFGGSYFMTRHAHPFFHRRAEDLFGALLGGKWIIENPFLQQTKRQVFGYLERLLDPAEANRIAGLTETCWYVQSNQYRRGRPKRNGEPCGLCVPCVVRRTALLRPEGSYDLRKQKVRKDLELSLHYHQIDAFVSRVEAARSDPEVFLTELPSWVADLPLERDLKLNNVALFGLFDQFAREFRTAFPEA
jgi:7-cyano-7-deazaguanine synthase in queuosine biosynthesis